MGFIDGDCFSPSALAVSEPYTDDELESAHAHPLTVDVGRLFATIDALRTEKGYSRCIKCHKLRPPTGTRDKYGREAGFYYHDLTCAACRRETANERRFWR